MKTNYWFVLIMILISGCKDNVYVGPSDAPIEETLDLLLQEAIDNSFDQIPGISMTVISPDLLWSGAAGYDSKEKERELLVDQPFRIASITKTFVAMSILRLHEMDSISIDDPIDQYISEEHKEILRQDEYDPSRILIRHCLNHTSGLFDYATNHDKYIEQSTQEPSKRWTRTEQLEGAIKWGDKQGEPGEKYLYCDTGYILLGEILERYFNGDLALALRTLLNFEKLNLNQTWLETLEPPAIDDYIPVRRYLGRLDVTDWDASVDLYGGGGLMSTTQDLARFIHALFNNEIFDDPSTLELMKTKAVFGPTYIPEEDDRFKDYRYGLWELPLYGKKAYLHGGLWGSTIIHIPEMNLSIATNTTKGRNARIIKKATMAIRNLKVQN